jgi:hypothetical protein
MNRQGTDGSRRARGLKFALLAATALIALAAPATASALTYVSGQDHGDHVHLYIDGDDSAQALTVTATSNSLTVTGGTIDSTDDDTGVNYCTGTGPVVCTFPSSPDVLVDTYLNGGDDTFDASGVTAAEKLRIDAGSGADTITAGPGSDNLLLQDGEADNASTCGGGTDSVTRDAGDSVLACEVTGLSLASNPVINGAPRVGNPLSVGGFSVTGGPPTDYYYYWYTCSSPTPSDFGLECGNLLSTATTYTPQPSDQGRYLFVDAEADVYVGDFLLDGVYTTSDAVLVTASPNTSPPPSNAFTTGTFKGTALTITTPGPGVLTSGPAGGAGASKFHAIDAKKKKKAKALVGTAKVTATGAGTFKLPVKLTSAGKKQLKKKKKLKTKVKVTFTPTGGTPASKTVSVTFKKKK